MSSSLPKPQRQEQIDINFKCETTSELHSACGCKSACEPILNMDGTVTTCSSIRGEAANNLRLSSVRNSRPNSQMEQTNTGFSNDENTFDRAFKSHGKISILYSCRNQGFFRISRNP